MTLKPLPPSNQPIVGATAPSLPYGQYFQSLDQTVRGILASPPNVQTANYVLALKDAGGIVEMNVAGTNTLTVPLNNTVAFPIGTQITVTQIGAGATTLTAAAGVTILNRSGLVLAGENAVARLYKRAVNTWVASGDLT